jgi:hypothetical protein
MTEIRKLIAFDISHVNMVGLSEALGMHIDHIPNNLNFFLTSKMVYAIFGANLVDL